MLLLIVVLIPQYLQQFDEIQNLNVTIFIHITVSQWYEGISVIYYKQFQPEPHPRLW